MQPDGQQKFDTQMPEAWGNPQLMPVGQALRNGTFPVSLYKKVFSSVNCPSAQLKVSKQSFYVQMPMVVSGGVQGRN